MVHYLVLSRHSVVRLPLLLGSRSALRLCSQFLKLSAWLLFSDDGGGGGDDDDDGDSSFFRNVGISVPGYTADIPEGLLFTPAAVRTLNLAFLSSRYKEKREGQLGAPVLTGHYFICKGIWVMVIINV